MRPLAPTPEPPGFDKRVRDRGNKWLAKNPTAVSSKFPDYWNEFRKEVQEAFEECCAYLGFPIVSGQVDHFIAKNVDKTRTYEWSNYRWGEPRVNQLKGTRPFLDPHSLEPGWVAIDPVTLEYKAGPNLPAHLLAEATNTFEVLNDPEIKRGRRGVLKPFALPEGGWDIPKLRLFFPLLAECAESFEREYQEFLAKSESV